MKSHPAPGRTRQAPAARRILDAAAAGLLLAWCPPAAAQEAVMAGRAEAVVGSEAEGYLRTLQVAGAVPLYPWSLRGFSPAELDRLAPDSAHPWRARHPVRPARRGVSAGLLPVSVRGSYSSAFAGALPGPAWEGRGANAQARAGVMMRAGPLSLRLEPVAFWAQNRAFALMDNGQAGELAFGDGRLPRNIDLPQRFGEGAYARLDPGESTLGLTAAGISAGASTAAQQWGPGADHPLVMGGNAGGFAHLFAGTARPVNVGVGRVHGRLVWGRLEQSRHSPVADSMGSRFSTAVVAVFTPRGLPGLELGGSRIFQVRWPEDGLSARDFRRVFEGFIKSAVDTTGTGAGGHSYPDNQIASVFARWVIPGAGLEAYGEFVREDHNWDLLDLALEPDHQSGYLLGFRKVWGRGPRMAALRGELVNTQASHLATVRNQPRMYSHAGTRQGHTHRGQLLASPFGYGGGGHVLALDRFHPRGRWTVAWSRERVGTRWTYAETGEADPRGTDVMHTLALDALLFRGGFDVEAGVSGSAELNRHHLRDAYNLRTFLGVRVVP